MADDGRAKMRVIVRYWLPLVVWMAVIFYFSAQPALPEHPDDQADRVIKKSCHLAEYAVLAGLWWRALRTTRAEAQAPALAAAFSILYALSDEWHQTFVPGRDGNLFDFAVDSAGVLIALGALWMAHRLRARWRRVGTRAPPR